MAHLGGGELRPLSVVPSSASPVQLSTSSADEELSSMSNSELDGGVFESKISEEPGVGGQSITCTSSIVLCLKRHPTLTKLLEVQFICLKQFHNRRKFNSVTSELVKNPTASFFTPLQFIEKLSTAITALHRDSFSFTPNTTKSGPIGDYTITDRLNGIPGIFPTLELISRVQESRQNPLIKT